MRALVILAVTGEGITIPFEVMYKLAGAAIVAALALLAKKSWPYISAHFSAVWKLRRAEQALDKNSPGLWLAPSISIEPPVSYQRSIQKSIPIVVVANLKGGVGKTTTVANLIGHYCLKKEKRVLAIDMDFQGSLSAIVLSQAEYDNALEEQSDGGDSKAAQLVEGRDSLWLRNASVEVDGIANARCIPSYYTLSSVENRVMVEWLIGKRKEDIRYSLASTLHDPQIQDRYDLILIDAPPRLTTGSIQALCSATHVLVPSVLDGLSAEASGGFVDQLCTNYKLWPHLKLLGVFGNMTDRATAGLDGKEIDGGLREYEALAVRSLQDTIDAALEKGSQALRAVRGTTVFPVATFIPQKAELGREAGNKIAYQLIGGSQAVQDLSRAYDRLGDEIDRRIAAKFNR